MTYAMAPGRFFVELTLMKHLLALLFSLATMAARADIKSQPITYTDAGTKLEGFYAYDDSLRGKLPAVLIIHDWDGLGDYEKSRARQIAGLGYVGFAADIWPGSSAHWA